jgi:prevent-host-death family protein
VKKVGLYEAKTHLSQLCEETARTGEACLISKNGRPLVKIVPYLDSEDQVSVWDTVEESRAKYGPLKDFDLPERRVRPDAASGCFDEDPD